MTWQIEKLQYPVVNLEVNEVILIQLELDRNSHFCILKL